jgi:archaellum biogenesis protein FlaJ (TadC family)
MNQKQLIAMWCGIAAVVLAGLTVIENYGLVSPYGFCVWIFITALVTAGLIYTFKGRKVKNKNTMQDIRNDILKKKQFRMRKDDRSKDK